MSAKFFHRSYSRMYSLRQWRRQHLNPSGAILFTAIALSLIFGGHITRTSIYQFASICCAAGLTGLLSLILPFRPKLTVRRILPDVVTAGSEIKYEIEITNNANRSEKGLFLLEIIHDPRPPLHALQTRPEPLERIRNWWDRKTLYYRWSWLISKRSKAVFSKQELPIIAPGATIRLEVGCLARHRGYLQLAGIAVLRPDILGLFNRSRFLSAADKLLILPTPVDIIPPVLTGSRHYHPGGISLASSVGNSDEFMSLRPYRPGDPLRNIHWRSYAKTGELIIREFEDEFYVRYAMILDTFLHDEGEHVFDEAVGVGASLLQSMQMHDAILDLMLVGDRAYSFSSGRGLAPVNKMLEILACAEPGREKSVESLLPMLKNNLKSLSGTICLFLGWNLGHLQIHNLLKQANIPTWIVVITDDKQVTQGKIANDLKEMDNITIRKVSPGDIEVPS